MKKLLKEFKEFATRGNMLDMAIGVIVGGAFTTIVNSLVKDIMTPALSILTGKVDFSAMTIPLGTGEEASAIAYGNFITAIINFFMIAICVFLLVKLINAMKNGTKRKKVEEPAPAPAPKRTCPYCCMEIADEATRCPHCTTPLEGFDGE